MASSSGSSQKRMLSFCCNGRADQVRRERNTEVRCERNWRGEARTVTEMKVDQGCAVRTLLVWSIKKSIRLW